VAVHARDVECLDIQGVRARARTHETLTQHLFLLVVIVARGTAAGARSGRGVIVAAAVVGALDLVLLEGAAGGDPPHLRRLGFPQPHPAAAAPSIHPDRGRRREARVWGWGGGSRRKGRMGTDEKSREALFDAEDETELRSCAIQAYSSAPIVSYFSFTKNESLLFFLFDLEKKIILYVERD
jgi:hypothetical protein